MRKFILIFVTIFLLTCKDKDNLRPKYPNINITISTLLPSYIPLTYDGGYCYVNGGLKGLIIYRLSKDDFRIFDRNCTINESNSCGQVDFSVNSGIGICSCDSTLYNIIDGGIIQGNAPYPLHNYNSSYNESNNTLHIYN